MIKSTTAKDKLNKVFKKDVLVSAATMTRKGGWQKSGGNRDGKRGNGVERKKKNGLHSQIFPIIASRNRERFNVTYLREWTKKSVPTRFESMTHYTCVLLSRSLIEPWRLRKAWPENNSHESTGRS